MTLNMFSTNSEKKEIEKILTSYLKLPFSSGGIPGSVMEHSFAYSRGDEVLNTYDFVDVVNREKKIGWQIKSTKASTPVTWMRAKLSGSDQLIIDSMHSEDALQFLGDSIIDYCNAHILHSFEIYDLDKIGYSRLISHKNGDIHYFEKFLCTRESPVLFHKNEFAWNWSNSKNTKSKKEQLSALQGIHMPTGKKWFSWHGRGENQLHFNGEKYWWPKDDKLIFKFPKDKIDLQDLIAFLDSLDSSIE